MMIETERLILHSLSFADLDNFAALYSDPEVNRYLSSKNGLTREQSGDRLKQFIIHQEAHGYGRFAVSLRDGTFVGNAGFLVWEETGETELGYLLKRSAWGKGYATEVATALIKWIFEATNLSHVIAFAEEENVASRKVLEKTGMTFTDIRLVKEIPFAFYALARDQALS
jgi:[ribosomal protein S5]-alanine N-acetyltransferase